MTVAARERILGYDLARALAVFGMVVVNYKVVMAGGGDAEADWLAGVAGLLDGRAAAMFVVLAGAGLVLFCQRSLGDASRLAAARSTLLRRAAFLLVVGLLYTPLWPGDILKFYGLYLPIGVAVVTVRDRWLGALAVSFALGFVVSLGFSDYETGWNWDTLAYERLWTPAGLSRHLFLNGFHPVVPWAGLLLVGMWLGRRDVRSPAVRRRLLVGGATLAGATEIASRLLVSYFSAHPGAMTADEVIALFGTSPMPPMPLYLVAAAATAIAVIALCLELGARAGQHFAVRPLVATGQLALTLYVGHVVIGMGVLEACGRLEEQTLRFALACAAGFCVASVVFAASWRRRFDRGPLEWIMRRLAG